MGIKLSFAIPTYNGGKRFQKRSLGTILPQLKGIEDIIEIVVSDNASTDNTAEVIKEYLEKYPFIKYCRNEKNMGVDRNFDLAVRRCSGEYVWLFSDDDLLEEGAVKKVLSVLEEHPDLAAVYVNYGLDKHQKIERDYICANGNEFVDKLGFRNGLMSSNIVKKSLWENTDTSKYFDTYGIHVCSMLEILATRPIYILAHPFLIEGVSEEASWRSNGSFVKYGPKMTKCIKGMHIYGYKKKIINKSISRAIRIDALIFLPLAKAWGLKVDYTLLKDYYGTYKEFSAFWLMTLPVLLMPNFFFRIAYKIIYPTRKRIRSFLFK